MFTHFVESLNQRKNRLYDHLAKRVGGCVLCGQTSGEMPASPRLCAGCAETLTHTSLEEEPHPRCTQCAHLLHTAEPLCGNCLTDPPAFDRSTVFADYVGQMQHALLQFKFHHALHLAPLLADGLRHALSEYAQTQRPDVLVLVPALPSRVQQRGFNPLRLIMQHIDLRVIWPSNTPVFRPDALMRVHHDQLQIHVKPDQRRKQVKNAFALAADFSPLGQHIAVIDDIITTGATLHEIAHTLKQSGARQVDNVLIARTPKSPKL